MKKGTPMPDWFRREWRQRAGVPLPLDVPARDPGEDEPPEDEAPPPDEDGLVDISDDDIPF